MEQRDARWVRLVFCIFLAAAMASTSVHPPARNGLPPPHGATASSDLWVGSLSPQHLFSINETFWATGINGSGQSIAIIDTGILASHEVFAGKVINWTDVTREASAVPVDLDGVEAGHGTMCASIAAGNSSTYRGIAPGAGIAVVKMFYVDGGSITAENADAAAAVDRVLELASSLNIKVASLSWGDDNASNGNDELSQIVEHLVDGGIVTVVAAGNVASSGKPARVAAPGSSEKVITVGSLDQLDFDVASFSLPGPTADNRVKPDVIAPGVGITGASHLSSIAYRSSQGTSFSTPLVSGIAMLLMERYPQLDHYQLKHLLCLTALECQYTEGNPDNREGWGIVNPAGVVAAMDTSWSLDTPLTATITMGKPSTRSFFARVHLDSGVTHRFTFKGAGGAVLDGRAEAYIYPALAGPGGTPELLARSRAGTILLAPGHSGDYILAVKPLPGAWLADGGSLSIPFTVTHVADLTIQAAWGIGIASAAASIILAVAILWNLRGQARWKME